MEFSIEQLKFMRGWTYTQRTLFNQNRLSKNRIEKLEKLNFNWSPWKWMSFNECRKYSRNLGLKSQRAWVIWHKNNKPINIPRYPNASYKEFINWQDWLGNSFCDFNTFVIFVKSIGLKNQKQWDKYCVSGNKPINIPSSPSRIYKEWRGWGFCLGTNRIACHKRQYRSFDLSRKFVWTLNLNGQKEWYEYCESGNKPSDVPTFPYSTYRLEYKGIQDWLGTKRKNRYSNE